MCESEAKAPMPEIIKGIAALTSFQDSQSYVTFLFSEWYIQPSLNKLKIKMKQEPQFHEIDGIDDYAKMADQWISDFYVDFTMNFCALELK